MEKKAAMQKQLKSLLRRIGGLASLFIGLIFANEADVLKMTDMR